MKVIETTVEELGALIEASDPDHPLLVGWGTGGFYDTPENGWAMRKLAEIRRPERAPEASDG